MDLETFITASLLQIYRGVENANKDLETSRVNDDESQLPKMFLLSPGADRNTGSGVFFDVAVAVKTDKNAGAGAKASILSVVEVEVGGQQGTTSEQTSRISFAVNTNRWHG